MPCKHFDRSYRCGKLHEHSTEQCTLHEYACSFAPKKKSIVLNGAEQWNAKIRMIKTNENEHFTKKDPQQPQQFSKPVQTTTTISFSHFPFKPNQNDDSWSKMCQGIRLHTWRKLSSHYLQYYGKNRIKLVSFHAHHVKNGTKRNEHCLKMWRNVDVDTSYSVENHFVTLHLRKVSQTTAKNGWMENSEFSTKLLCSSQQIRTQFKALACYNHTFKTNIFV